MPPLELRDLMAIGTAVAGITGVIWAQRVAQAKSDAKLDAMSQDLREGQAEGLRQLQALHKRMDYYGERIQSGEIAHARLEERVANLRTTQRLRLTEGD